MSPDGVELRFWAAVHSIETGEEGRLATFYLMNTSLNRNLWRVTDEALEGAAPTLMGKPLGCIPGYRVNHVHEPIQVGRWIKVEKPDGYTLATAEITDGVAWEKIRSGEWGPVSAVIRAFRVTCSVCGRDITAGPDEHVQSGEGHEVVESFVFDRVDFVEEPAYPQAGILTLGQLVAASAPDLLTERAVGAAVIGRTPEFIASQSNMDGAQGPRGNPKPDEKRENKEMSGELVELQHELEKLQAEKAELKRKLERIEAERHQELVDAALGARLRAGLFRDRKAEAGRLKDLNDAALILLREDAERVAERMARAPVHGPKARYSADAKSGFDAAVEDMRERLFGQRLEVNDG